MGERGGRADSSLVWLLALALFILATVGMALVVITLIGNGDETPVQEVAATDVAQQVPERPEPPEKPLVVTSAELERAVAAAGKESGLGDSNGEISVVVWGRDWDAPADFQGDVVERLWSLSKPVIALTALRGGADRGPGRELVEESITRSSNCAARSMVVDLESSGGAATPSRSLAAFEEVLGDAGITLSRGPEIAIPQEDGCAENGYPTLSDSSGTALPLFGTAEWTSLDAARFMRALGDMGYGRPGEEVLGVMGRPKLANEDPGASCDPGRPEPDKWVWGIGEVFEEWKTYSKSAWGGGEDGSGPVMFSQMGLVEREDESFAIAVSLRLPEHLGGDPGSQCVTLEEIEVVEEVLEQVEPLLSESRKDRRALTG